MQGLQIDAKKKKGHNGVFEKFVTNFPNFSGWIVPNWQIMPNNSKNNGLKSIKNQCFRYLSSKAEKFGKKA